MDGLSFFTSSDVPKLLEELQRREGLALDPEALGWSLIGDSYAWAPPTDPKQDPEFFDLLDGVDWDRAESGGFTLWEFLHSGHNRETLMYRLKQFVLPRFSKPRLTTLENASVTLDEERGA